MQSVPRDAEIEPAQACSLPSVSGAKFECTVSLPCAGGVRSPPLAYGMVDKVISAALGNQIIREPIGIDRSKNECPQHYREEDQGKRKHKCLIEPDIPSGPTFEFLRSSETMSFELGVTNLRSATSDLRPLRRCITFIWRNDEPSTPYETDMNT